MKRKRPLLLVPPLKDLDNLPYIETSSSDKIQNLNIPSTALSNKNCKTFNIPLVHLLVISRHYASASTPIPTKEVCIKQEHSSIQPSTLSHPDFSDPNVHPIPLSKPSSSPPNLPSNGRGKTLFTPLRPLFKMLSHSWMEMGLQDHALSFSMTVEGEEVNIVVRNTAFIASGGSSISRLSVLP